MDAGLIPFFRTPGGQRRVEYDALISFAADHQFPTTLDISKFDLPTDHTTTDTILLIDDNEMDLALNSAIIKKMRPGITLITSTSGVHSSFLADGLHSKLILLDIVMPEIDGIQVCHSIRKNSSSAKPVILGVSGTAHPHEIQALLDAGAEAVLSKPLRFEKISGFINRIFPKSVQVYS